MRTDKLADQYSTHTDYCRHMAEAQKLPLVSHVPKAVDVAAKPRDGRVGKPGKWYRTKGEADPVSAASSQHSEEERHLKR